jgi:hypothetical protein
LPDRLIEQTTLYAELFITPAALTTRSCQPGIEPASRDTERLAQARPMDTEKVFAD